MPTTDVPAAVPQSQPQYDHVKLQLQTFSVVRERGEPGRKIEGPADASEVLLALFGTVDHDCEHFVLLALDARGRVSGYKVVSSGTSSACLVHPREVFRAAVALSAQSIIVAHNHPSGDPVPSMEDISLACRLEAAGKLLGIPIVDQFIVITDAEPSRGRAVSFHSQRT